MQISFVSQVLLNILVFDFGGIGNSNIGSLFKNEWVFYMLSSRSLSRKETWPHWNLCH